MDKNYYDILQVNKNASPEIIEKAYKTLAKKYHPDLQAEKNKKQAETILKEINEAYEVLSSPEKKEIYDRTLWIENKRETSSNTSNIPNKEEILQQKLQQELEMKKFKKKQELLYQQQIKQAMQQAYHDAYIQDLKNRGYRIRYKKSFKDYLRGFAYLIVVFIILFLVWQIPFVQNFFIHLIQNNPILNALFSNF